MVTGEGQKVPGIDLDDETAMGRYCNQAIVAHSGNDFVMDFIFDPPHGQKARVRARIILTPQNAKRFLVQLDAAIAAFEGAHGVIG